MMMALKSAPLAVHWMKKMPLTPQMPILEQSTAVIFPLCLPSLFRPHLVKESHSTERRSLLLERTETSGLTMKMKNHDAVRLIANRKKATPVRGRD